MSEVLTGEIASAILEKLRENQQAVIFEGGTQKPFSVQSVTIDLTTARSSEDPLKFGFPFKSVYVQDATDSNAVVQLRVNARDSYQSSMKLKSKDSWIREYPVSEAYLHWDAQTGKSITLQFFVDSEFHSGSQINQIAGGVSINDGTSFSTGVVTLAATTAAALVAQDTTRKIALIQNTTGASIWVGNSSVSNTGSNKGIEVLAGDSLVWRNTAALYGYSVLGGDCIQMSEF